MTDRPRNVAIKSLKTAKFLKRITFSRTPPRAKWPQAAYKGFVMDPMTDILT